MVKGLFNKAFNVPVALVLVGWVAFFIGNLVDLPSIAHWGLLSVARVLPQVLFPIKSCF